MLDTREIDKFYTAFLKAKKILLVNHIRMDGDAWGSLAGFYFLCKKVGKEVRASNDGTVPPSFHFLGNIDIIENNLDIENYNPDLIISFDASDSDRLGNIYQQFKDVFHRKDFVVIDHHISNPGFGKINCINTSSTSTCELLFDICEYCHWTQYFDAQIASYLYLGLQTDTNMYFNTNVTPHSLEVGSKLLAHGAEYRKIISECFQKKSMQQLKLWQVIISRIQRVHDDKICYTYLTREDIETLNLHKDTLGGYLKSCINEILINIDGVDIAFLIYPLSKVENKVSLRSSAQYSIHKICEKYGGGGHQQAAGFQSEKNIQEIIDILLQDTQKLF